jgi:hypothetical protein
MSSRTREASRTRTAGADESTAGRWDEIVALGNRPAAQFIAETFPDEIDASSSFVIGSAEGTMLCRGYESTPEGQALRERVKSRLREFGPGDVV